MATFLSCENFNTSSRSAILIDIRRIIENNRVLQNKLCEAGPSVFLAKFAIGRSIEQLEHLEQRLYLNTNMPSTSDEYRYELLTRKNLQTDELRLQMMQRRTKKTPPNVKVNYIVLRDNEDVQCVIQSHLYEIEMSNCGVFNKRQNIGAEYIAYLCERKNKTIRGHTDPTVSRANGCTAYISFCVQKCLEKRVLVIRSRLQHLNHNPSCRLERMCCQLHPNVRDLIERLSADNKKPAAILIECLKWAKTNGHTDVAHRRYYPTLYDVQTVVGSVKRRLRLGPDDASSVEILCTHVLKESIAFFQPLNRAIGQDMIIVYQSKEQRERSKDVDIVFMDATYKGVTVYRYAFYVLIGRNNNGRGTPLAYIILTKDDALNLEKALTVLKNSMSTNNVCFEPRAFMIDRDMREINAIKAVFPHSTILLCWFHVMQAVYRWLNTPVSTVSGKEGVAKRKEIVCMMRTLRFCNTEEDFDNKLVKMVDQLPIPVYDYLLKEWLPNGRMWANFGRPFCHGNHDTNNLAERFFLCLKYQHFGGYANQRVDDLLLKLDGDVSLYYNYIEELTVAGRQCHRQTFTRGSDKANTLILQNWVEKTKSCNHGVYLVPSASDANEWHKVDVARCTCDCIAASQEGMCKHVHVALQKLQLSGSNIEELRRSVAKDIFDTDGFDYTAEQTYFCVYDGHYINTVNTTTKKCSCIAASHQQKCICVLVLEMVTSHAVLPTATAAASSSLIESDSNLSLPVTASPLTEANCNLPHDTEIVNPLEQLREKCDEVAKHFTNLATHLAMVADCPNSIAATIRQTHNLVFRSYSRPVRHYGRKRIQTMSSFPSRLAKKKREGDHAYASVPGSVTVSAYNVDGSAKRSHRSKNVLRLPFGES